MNALLGILMILFASCSLHVHLNVDELEVASASEPDSFLANDAIWSNKSDLVVNDSLIPFPWEPTPIALLEDSVVDGPAAYYSEVRSKPEDEEYSCPPCLNDKCTLR